MEVINFPHTKFFRKTPLQCNKIFLKKSLIEKIGKLQLHPLNTKTLYLQVTV